MSTYIVHCLARLRPVPSPARSLRARVRAEMTLEILAAAREELAEVGAAALSIRSVARRLGLAPSALYRYFPSRDALLTALIREAYEEVGSVAEREASGEGTAMERWVRLALAVRAWAFAEPQRWALIYGSPVPGYAAPPDTVRAALRITEAVVSLVPPHRPDTPSAPPAGLRGSRSAVLPPAPELDAVIAPVRDSLLPGRPSEIVAGALLAWTSLVGMVSLELFGHYTGATTQFEPVFRYSMEVAGRLAGMDAP